MNSLLSLLLQPLDTGVEPCNRGGFDKDYRVEFLRQYHHLGVIAKPFDFDRIMAVLTAHVVVLEWVEEPDFVWVACQTPAQGQLQLVWPNLIQLFSKAGPRQEKEMLEDSGIDPHSNRCFYGLTTRPGDTTTRSAARR